MRQPEYARNQGHGQEENGLSKRQINGLSFVYGLLFLFWIAVLFLCGKAAFGQYAPPPGWKPPETTPPVWQNVQTYLQTPMPAEYHGQGNPVNRVQQTVKVTATYVILRPGPEGPYWIRRLTDLYTPPAPPNPVAFIAYVVPPPEQVYSRILPMTLGKPVYIGDGSGIVLPLFNAGIHDVGTMLIVRRAMYYGDIIVADTFESYPPGEGPGKD